MPVSRQELWSAFSGGLAELLREKGLDVDEVMPTATLAELAITSIDTMHLMIVVEEKLQLRLDFNRLVNEGGTFVDDLTLAELSEQLYRMAHSGTMDHSSKA